MKATISSIALVSICFLCTSSLSSVPQTHSILPDALPLKFDDSVRDKNFYFLHILDSSSAAVALRADTELNKLRQSYRSRLLKSLTDCAHVASCYVDAARLSEADVETAKVALRNLYDRDSSVREAVEQLRRSGVMIRSQGESDRQLIGETWQLSASSINRILDTYGDGVSPPTGDIDSMSEDAHSEDFAGLLQTAARVVLATDVHQRMFFSDPLQFAELALTVNGRDEAGRFEPLEEGENQLALKQISSTDWTAYPYAVILVPGIGPDVPNERLSAGSRLHLELAVEQYRQKAAPFLLVSGGFVHPPRTPFSEAIEMKRALIEDYHVPAAAILVDPHARHTTTNVRNAARMLYRYGIPFSKAALVVTDEYQANDIMEQAFDERNLQETGTLPYRSKRRLSPVEIEIVPSVDALQVNWKDPLDP